VAKTNVRTPTIRTHEGAPAKRIGDEAQLRRSVMACMLWEDQFYEDGVSIAERIAEGVRGVSRETASQIAIEAREDMKLRHAPLLVAREMARKTDPKDIPGPVVGDTIARVIQRADELAEFVSLYWKDGKQPLSSQVKRGLAEAFRKFDEYQLAKYNRDAAIKLRDVLFLCHAKPKDEAQAALWKKLVDGTLETPDTWEVASSSGAGKREMWERLLIEKKLGALALLRNLRNMEQAGVEKMVKTALANMNVSRVLPFRFIAAAKYAPQLEPELEAAMFRSIESRPKLPGKTAIVVDVSGSMYWSNISAKSKMLRMDAACAIAMIARELCEDPKVYSFSDTILPVPPRHGFGLRDAIKNQPNRGTYLGASMRALNAEGRYDRAIVITDEQSADPVPDPRGKGYMINVASYKNGVGYGPWTHIDGFSEAVLDYIARAEG